MTAVLEVPADASPIAAGTSAPSQPRRDRLAFAGLLLGTALLYLVGLSESGWANQFYAAAAQAGSKSWTAFLFGSLDASNFITVDKPPAALWVMDVSVKVFGLNSWSVLVPQALEGVAAVAVLYAAVKRVAGPNAGLLAGAVLATTPVAALMFRYDNPDALLVLLMTAAAYATVRAIERGHARWLMLAGALVGFAFLTKMLQAFLVVPGLWAAYLVAAPVSMRKRIEHTAASLGALILGAGWWIALVELWPAGSRPYIGGSNHNSILELTFGYNGLGRLDGSSNNGAVGGGTGGFSSSQAGLGRLFGSEMGTQISWLLPAALVALCALGTVVARRARTDALRASVIVWGGWLLVTGAVLSFASGIIHPYYTVALAPAIAALVGIGTVTLWRQRHDEAARWWLATLVGAGAAWSWLLLGRSTWHPELRWIVALAGIGAVWLILSASARVALVSVVAVVAMLAAPTAYAVATASAAHTGAIPSAGPATSTFGGGGFGGPRSVTRPGGGGGGAGGLGGANTVGSELVAALQDGSYAWAAATTGDNEAASLELASGTSVMALGGYNGTDPAITLDAFKALVAAGKVHYYIANESGFIGSTDAQTSTAYAIQQWVTSTFTAQTIGSTTVYDLTG